MKKILCLFLFVGIMNLNAQEVDAAHVMSPKIICKVKLGEIADFGNFSVKFIQVVSDSRCPKNVTCVWAGEAKVLVEIYKDDEMLEQKEVVIARGANMNRLLSLKQNSVEVYGLSPYPVDNTSIKAEDYVLNLIVIEL